MISSVGQSPTEPLVLGQRHGVAKRPSAARPSPLPPAEVPGYAAGARPRRPRQARPEISE